MTFTMDAKLAVDVVMQVVHSMRFEFTCCVGLIAFLFLGRLMPGPRQRPQVSRKGAYPMHDSSSPSRSNAVPERRPWPSRGARPPMSAASSAEQLRDPAWVLPQIGRLCRSHVQQALDVYRASLKAGLDYKLVPALECQQVFVAMVTAAIRIGNTHEAQQLMRDLQEIGPGVPLDLFASVAKLCTSKQLFAECLSMYDSVTENPNYKLNDKSIWSCLLFCAVETKSHMRCVRFFENLKANGEPSSRDYGNMVRHASSQKDWKLALQLTDEMCKSGLTIDRVIYNTALATCVIAGQVADARHLLALMEDAGDVTDVITYNTLMKGYAKGACMDECFELFEHMRSRGIEPSQVTYGILLDCCINENQVERATEVFNTMVEEGCQMNTILYTTLIKGFARAGQVDQAMHVYEQMRSDRSLLPDLITFSILIKAHCDVGHMEAALKLLEAMVQLGLRPDEMVFNTLLTGCAHNGNAELGKQLYADMVASGFPPSNATFSILVRLHAQCKSLDDAVEMFKREPPLHKVDLEPRIYTQLIQSCIRVRQGRRAIEVYEMMCAVCTPTASAHSTVMTTCLKLNMFDTASEILGLAAEAGGRIDARDASTLLESALKKRKVQCVQACVKAIDQLGLVIDQNLMAEARR